MANIVIVEDDAHILRIVSMWLKRNQHTVFEAANGRTGLELIEQHRPDILVTDVNMPQMDGVELIHAAARLGLPTVGVICLTSRCDQAELSDRLKGLNVRMRPKPFSPTGLAKDVQILLETSCGSDDSGCDGSMPNSEVEKANAST